MDNRRLFTTMLLCLVIFFFLQVFDPFGIRQRKPDLGIKDPAKIAADDADIPKLHPTGHPRKFFTLGSLDNNATDCLLVTFDSRGAGIRRIELVQRDAKGRFLTKEVENKSGYLGYLELQSDSLPGGIIQALPDGSPLTTAVSVGDAPLPVQLGDRLLSVDGQPILQSSESEGAENDLDKFLQTALPEQKVTLVLARPIPQPVDAEADLELEQPAENQAENLAQDTAAQDTAAQDTAAQDTAAQDTAAQDTAKSDPVAEVVQKTDVELTPDRWKKYTVEVTLMSRPKQMMGPEYRTGRGDQANYPNSLEFSLQDASRSQWTEFDLAMRHGNWEGRQFVDAQGRPCVEFTYQLPKAVYRRLVRASQTLGAALAPDNQELDAAIGEGIDGAVVVVKRYRLPRIEVAQRHDPSAKGYHVEMELEVYNRAGQALDVAYRLGGPVATSIEGWWYQIKLHGGFWKLFYSAGARDIISSSTANPYQFFGRAEITSQVDKNIPFPIFPSEAPPEARTVQHAGVDTLYFASALLPQTKMVDPENPSPLSDYICYSGYAGPAGEILKGRDALQQDLTFRLYKVVSLPPSAEVNGVERDGDVVDEAEIAAANAENEGLENPGYRQEFHLFAGPKRPELLAKYKLDNAISFGWFGLFSVPLVWLLHLFYYLFGNYGLAIIMLTVVVRLAMMPISRKAVINAQMMQALAPEMKKIKERHPDSLEKQGVAQRELFRRFKYNPFSGCLIVFLQLPIFIGLYRGLSVDFELRDQPLIPGISWCSNLAGPDQLWNWSDYMPSFLAAESGWLGPYFNLLPILTIVLFIAQQKIFMPPPTDEQQAMMQKMMSYMMIFMGFMFFKVPAGLCLYFITSSIWGLVERAVIPKPQLSQDILDSIQRDNEAEATSTPSKPTAKSRQEMKERQRRNKEKRKE